MPPSPLRRGLPIVLLVSCALLLSLLAGCDGGGGGGGTPTSASLQVGLTDRQSDEFQQVVVAIREVRLVPNGLEDAADNDARLPVVVTYGTPHVVDILTLRFQQELLGTVTVPVGTYTQLRLVLEPNPPGQSAPPVNFLTLKTAPSVRLPLTTPSGQQSGLKVLGRFQVQPALLNAILIDFDPNTAIVARGNGAFNLKPTGIRIIQSATPLGSFGTLSGQVVSTFRNFSSATVSVVPQGSASPVAASTIFGTFSSSRWVGPFSAFAPAGTYRVHVQAAGFAHYSTPLRSIAAGSDTPLGDLLLLPSP